MMNERIQELAKQSTTIEYGVDNGFDRVTFDKEKFAELIVRECMDNLAWHGHDEAVSQLEWFLSNKIGN
jgi:hypothetical protein